MAITTIVQNYIDHLNPYEVTRDDTKVIYHLPLSVVIDFDIDIIKCVFDDVKLCFERGRSYKILEVIFKQSYPLSPVEPCLPELGK